MHLKELTAVPLPVRRHRLDASLNFFVATCFLVQTIGCVHQAAEQRSSPRKSSTTDGQPAATPQPLDPSGKPKSAEKKTSVAKEKKSPASVEAKPGKKQEQSEEEPNADTFAPPPPLRPPTFGGAGG
jgi:hypothetical protein